VALDHDLVHAVMHGSIFAAALAFWTMIARVRDRGFGVRIVALFVCFKFSLILGALLTFSGRALYPVYGSRPDAWGLTPVEDQQLAGVLMMTAAAMMYLVAALVVAAFLLFMMHGNHTGLVEDLYLIGFAVVLVGIVVRDIIVRRKPR